jgi:RNA polymerase sigma-70 factor (ECF subfamily)
MTGSDSGATPKRLRPTSDDLIDMIPALRVYARSLMRGGNEVDDLVQETLLKALANVGRFEPGTNLRAWLFTIMRNSFLTGIVKSKRERVGGEGCVSGNVICFPRHDSQIAHNRMMEAISRLPGPFREALILVFLMGDSYQDVATICGCAIGTVKSRVSRARQMIMRDLGATKASDMIASDH